MLRRAFLALGFALSLAACAGMTADQVVVKVAGIAQTVAGGLKGALPTIAAVTGLSADNQAAIIAAIADIQVTAAALQGVSTQAAAQPLVQKVETDLNAVLAALGKAPSIPQNVQLYIQAATVLVTGMETALNMIVPASLKARATVPMTPDEAVLIMQGAAQGR